MLATKPMFIALDFPSGEEALSFLDQLAIEEVAVKVGMELFYKEGPSIIEQLKQRNYKIFLDLKLHDIPNTVERAMKNLASLGVDVVNVHAAGGKRMIEAAQKGLQEGAINGQKPLLLAVTQLTSTDDEMLSEQLLIQEEMEQVVKHYAYNAKQAGADGVVCSVWESRLVHDICGTDFYTVTPGIRMENQHNQDQVRVATPTVANEQGVSAIVVGRGITKAEDPVRAYHQFEGAWNNGNETTIS
ncbi:orotidine-5'-phosphate decarboxylase [Pontibacillus litoralis]|uniref:Orotidine 5'-phosphate decarboxylase n=1 Tax=Pontibacillus litoralis JSM 072002 TaxID=1385512 RepID=A0A0A5G5Y7_9BACI|nr:orotidine-5'-phosphate decarboxylase [Pontibacillus litoralis]KGX88511.1 orotidine 5'-phosphate decarboxylase [Pontibacillus litoralis JSM 072002]